MDVMYRLMVTGGGTGGHVYPALTLARAFQQRHPDARILFVGTLGGLESRVVPAAGFDLETIEVRGLVGKSPGQIARGLRSLWRGMGQARRVVRSFRPHLVVGTGGYVSGPVVWVAARAGIPTLIQEQNVRPGVTNRVLSLVAARVAIPHQEATRHFPRRARTVATGNPIRPEIMSADRASARRQLSFPETGPLVLVTGGSQGAATINAAVLDMLSGGTPPCHMLWVTGHGHHVTIGHEINSRGINLDDGPYQVRVMPYLEQLPQGLAASDLVIGRAGAMTLAEITARGLPSILIPFPHAASREQELNARLMSRTGAAVVIADGEADGQRLRRALEEILGNERVRESMASASRALGRPDAADTIVDEMEALLEGKV